MNSYRYGVFVSFLQEVVATEFLPESNVKGDDFFKKSIEFLAGKREQSGQLQAIRILQALLI